jgi:hypothetical protein
MNISTYYACIAALRRTTPAVMLSSTFASPFCSLEQLLEPEGEHGLLSSNHSFKKLMPVLELGLRRVP